MGRIKRLAAKFLYLQLLGLVAAVSLLIPFARAAESDFPFPDSLRPAVDFWIKVYSEINTDSALLHDAENLAVAYGIVAYDNQVIKQAEASVLQDLRVLAGGKREGLTSSQQHILDQWPEGVSNARLARAVDNLRYQRGQADRFQRGIRRSGAFRDYIEQVVEDKGLPIELAALPHVESSFQTGAFSSASAGGMWQFMRGTARRFMRVDYLVDERLDPYVSTHAALDLLQINYEMLGTWPLALTAYNHGAYGMERAVQQVGSTDIARIIEEYKGPSFGFASRNFYVQFLAALEVERRQEEFFGTTELDVAKQFAELELPVYLDVATLVDSLGVDVNQLQRDNPALRPPVWSGEKRIPKGYRLRIDRRHYDGDLLAAIEQLPASQRHAEQIPDQRYTIRSGDTLGAIAARYDVSITELVDMNELRNRNQIRIGQTLLLPSSTAADTRISGGGIVYDSYEVRSGDSLEAIALRYGVSVTDLVDANQLRDRNQIRIGQTLLLPTSSTRAASPSNQYEVKSGDTLETIAARYGIAVADLAQVNQLRDRNRIRIGQVLLLPATGGNDSLIPASGRYEVRRGDTLSQISLRFNVPVGQLLALNGMDENAVIYPGQHLQLVQSDETATAADNAGSE